MSERCPSCGRLSALPVGTSGAWGCKSCDAWGSVLYGVLIDVGLRASTETSERVDPRVHVADQFADAWGEWWRLSDADVNRRLDEVAARYMHDLVFTAGDITDMDAREAEVLNAKNLLGSEISEDDPLFHAVTAASTGGFRWREAEIGVANALPVFAPADVETASEEDANRSRSQILRRAAVLRADGNDPDGGSIIGDLEDEAVVRAVGREIVLASVISQADNSDAGVLARAYLFGVGLQDAVAAWEWLHGPPQFDAEAYLARMKTASPAAPPPTRVDQARVFASAFMEKPSRAERRRTRIAILPVVGGVFLAGLAADAIWGNPTLNVIVVIGGLIVGLAGVVIYLSRLPPA